MKSPNIGIFIFLAIFLTTEAAGGQVLMNPQLPAAGLLHKSQLWNILLISHYDYNLGAQLYITMTDVHSGQKVLTGMSGHFTISKGAKQTMQADLEPVQYNYNGLNISNNNTEGLLAAGKYMICYTLVVSSNKTGLPVSEACVPVEIDPLTPPLLITPADTSWVESRYPNFTWLPPSPAAMVPQLHYEILLVEMKEGQNAYDAVQKNTPVYMQKYLSAAFLLYPSSARSLERGKHYAWQVIARNGEAYVQKTEAWSFKVKPTDTIVNLDTVAYPKLKKGYDAHSYICRNNIKFEYNNETGDSSVKVTIYEWQGEPGRETENRLIRMKPGQNFIEMEMSTRKYKNRQQYLIEVINDRKETWNLKFTCVRE
ncbi:hypothetical protein [Agriterribacter sp.]|uniref:hypothetical protein n=1 Tax=Agriterribacter sp. TaxID=2821509 RepID=UPI002C64B3E6|nr:hypothetical protein [Agriterribacter sp.]HRP55598.1 hypothetical protein [Agriterribacter sp.]